MDDDTLKDDEEFDPALVDDELEDDDLDLPEEDDDIEDDDDLDPNNLGKLGFGIEEEDETF